VADLQTTLRKLNRILDNLGSNSEQLDEIFNDFKATPKLLNRTLSNANDKIDSLTYNLNLVTRNVNSALSELKPTLEQLPDFF
jgi:ABC-type transporter Mla subunit MlaD